MVQRHGLQGLIGVIIHRQPRVIYNKLGLLLSAVLISTLIVDTKPIFSVLKTRVNYSRGSDAEIWSVVDVEFTIATGILNIFLLVLTAAALEKSFIMLTPQFNDVIPLMHLKFCKRCISVNARIRKTQPLRKTKTHNFLTRDTAKRQSCSLFADVLR